MLGVWGIVCPLACSSADATSSSRRRVGGQVSPNGSHYGGFHRFGVLLAPVVNLALAVHTMRSGLCRGGVARRQCAEARRQPLSTANVMPTAVSSGARLGARSTL